MFQIYDIDGNPMLTWQNLCLFTINSILIYYSLKLRITMVFMSKRRRRK
jgi:hypothetical protein